MGRACHEMQKNSIETRRELLHTSVCKPISFVRTKETGFRSQRKAAGGFQVAVIPAGMTDSPASGRVRLSRGTQFPLENPLALRGGQKFFLWIPGCGFLNRCLCGMGLHKLAPKYTVHQKKHLPVSGGVAFYSSARRSRYRPYSVIFRPSAVSNS